jgi:hypothetical protein
MRCEMLAHVDQAVPLQLALVQHSSATIVQLRDEKRIDDAVRHDLTEQLDVEEKRSSALSSAEY